MDEEVVTRLRQLLQDVDMETTTGPIAGKLKVVLPAVRLIRQRCCREAAAKNTRTGTRPGIV